MSKRAPINVNKNTPIQGIVCAQRHTRAILWAMARWLVTGGSGSFGTAFIRTVLATRPDVELVSISRNAEQRYKLEALAPAPRLRVLPADIRHIEDLRPIFNLGFETVIHAAAEKHIGTGQRHSAYVRDINVNGALNVAALARATGVKRLLALSTDKACDPTSYYGETKAEAERRLLQQTSPATRISAVRYGNVVGSSGSVIPLFLKQRDGKRLTVTDRRMTRFWMPLADEGFCDSPVFQEPGRQPAMSAVRWVLNALEQMQGGEIFVPEIPAARVEDVARAICPDAEIVEIGIRDGEKLHEDLISQAEGHHAWRLPRGGWVLHRADNLHAIVGDHWRREDVGFKYASDMALQPVIVEAA